MRGRLVPALVLAITVGLPAVSQEVGTPPLSFSPTATSEAPAGSPVGGPATPPTAAPAARGHDDARPLSAPKDATSPLPSPAAASAPPPVHPPAHPPASEAAGATDAPTPAPAGRGETAPPASPAAGPPPLPGTPPTDATDPLRRPSPRPEGDVPASPDTGAQGTDPDPSLPTPPSEGALSFPAQTPPSAGALIPPEAYATPVAPFQAATGPGAYEQLRESDFDLSACQLGLSMLGVEYADVAPLTDPDDRDCGIARPIEVREIQPGITVEGGAVMRCDTARSLALWMREMVIPAAGRMAGSPQPTSITVGTTYACRGVVGGASEARISEHALGNAIDIAAFGFGDGSRQEISPPGDRGDLGVAFQNAVQGSACLYFATVLGPGSNAAHDDHLHLDIKARRGGFRLCQ